MVRKNKNLVTETEFARLISGNIVRIYSMNGKCKMEYDRSNRQIVMENISSVSKDMAILSYDHTNLDRLNAHWIGFIG
ncbi:hypothetical protein [Caulobacter phage Cr30]|uniref:hypothetical protein n=1 Tax=Caulobacter phage Cr30 TaxID=1357714 RepID=UPI0004A9B96B|nr:hypothetical protein OZ74_gp161 [Caulobacter phage Cr30]AGS81046.1 hypothetical protein [Caulobacter phage Cr30]